MNEDLVQRLLEELLESGRSVDDVCAAHPELLKQVRQHWRRLRSVQAKVEELFPAGGGPAAAPHPAPPAIPREPEPRSDADD